MEDGKAFHELRHLKLKNVELIVMQRGLNTLQLQLRVLIYSKLHNPLRDISYVLYEFEHHY